MKKLHFTKVTGVLALVIACVTLTLSGTSYADQPRKTVKAAPVAALVLPPGAPSGCTPGDFCTYNEGNGGDLCQQFNTTQNLAALCENSNESAYNYENYYANLYWGANETGAYIRMPADSYLLYMQNNTFNACPGGGTSCAGYGQAVGDNVESVYIP